MTTARTGESSGPTRPLVIAIDAGTTGVRSRAVAPGGGEVVASYREFTQHFPQPGWVEHDADEIWDAVVATLADVVARVGAGALAAIGITNQRETVLAWDRTTGQPYGTAIVWQDRRTAERCDELAAAGHLARVREVTGLVLDPYFSGTKAAWLLEHREIPRQGLAIGTIDSWLVWKLTDGASFVTDTTNASRTMLFDIRSMCWSDEMCDLLGVPVAALPEVRPSSGRLASVSGDAASRTGLAAGTPISGIAGDQQAALFGQACFSPGAAKNTYGTGSFVLLNTGSTCPPAAEGMLTTVAWSLADGTVAYAYEGAIFVTGAAVQWLRDGLGLISSSAEVGPLAESVPDSGGV
ncbi:MAG: FGGY family carbohydrate kinase [Ilumatobacteraceae bacterium]